MKYFFSLLVFLFTTGILNAQTIRFTGIVQDAHTAETINFASAYLLVQGNGSITDSTGKFSLLINTNSGDSIVISYVGYENYRIPVNAFSTDTLVTISLQRSAPVKDVLVRAKINKGLFLWKKIMSKKKLYNRYNLPNFSYEAYNKLEIDLKNFKPEKMKKNFILKPFSFVFDNIDSTSEKEPFLPAYLIETISDYAYQKSPKKFYENIKASNTKGFKNESISKMLGVMNQNVNIYSNYIKVMDKDFISPFNENADVYYNFSVPDTQILNNQKLFHFVFKPKRAGQNTFEGDAWVVAQTFQIKKIFLYLGKDANVNYIDRVSVFQEFIPYNDSIFFLNRDKFFADFKILGKNSLTLIGRKSTSYKDIRVNSDSLQKLFDTQTEEEVLKSNTGLNNYSDSAWQNLRHDSLSVNEKAIYTTIDKLLQMPKFQRLQKRLRFLGTGYTDDGNVEFGPWFNWISSNAWEGTRFRFDLGTNTGFHKKIYLHGYLAYGTKDNSFKGKAEAFWILQREPRRIRLHAAYSNDIDNGISQVGEVSQDNIFSIAIRKPNVSRKFLRVQDTRFEAFGEIGKGFSTELFVVHRKYYPLLNLPFISLAKISPLTSFELSAKFRFAYLEQFLEGDYFRYSLGSKYPIAEIMFTKGIAGVANSDNNYFKVAGSVKDNFRVSSLGRIYWKAYAGKITGNLPFTFLENHPGNDLYYYTAGSFNLMNRFEYLSDKYWGANIEHSIGSGLFRFIPITRKLKWRQFWNVKMLKGSLSDANITLNNVNKNFRTLNNQTYIEAGTGIDNIFKVLRLDFVWRLSPSDPANFGNSKFGVFGSFQFQF